MTRQDHADRTDADLVPAIASEETFFTLAVKYGNVRLEDVPSKTIHGFQDAGSFCTRARRTISPRNRNRPFLEPRPPTTNPSSKAQSRSQNIVASHSMQLPTSMAIRSLLVAFHTPDAQPVFACVDGGGGVHVCSPGKASRRFKAAAKCRGCFQVIQRQAQSSLVQPNVKSELPALLTDGMLAGGACLPAGGVLRGSLALFPCVPRGWKLCPDCA